MKAMQSKTDIKAFIDALRAKQVKDPVGFENELKKPAENINELFYCYFIVGNKALELIDLRVVVTENDGRMCWAYFAVFTLSSATGKYEFQKLIKCDRYSVDSNVWDLNSLFETLRYKKRVQSLNGRGDYYRFISAYCMLLKEGRLKTQYADFEAVEFKE